MLESTRGATGIKRLIQPDCAFSPAGENKYPPPRMVRITAGLAGSGSILRRISHDSQIDGAVEGFAVARVG